jgi:16S rRNA (guanine966-N2)-methyltransferase
VFVEPQALAARAISSVIDEWAVENASVETCTAERFLARPASCFGLVFLDPPFDAGLLEPTAQMLTRRGWLAPDALIYVEQPRTAPPVALPESWQPRNSGTAGAVSYHLYQHRHSGEPRP